MSLARSSILLPIAVCLAAAVGCTQKNTILEYQTKDGVTAGKDSGTTPAENPLEGLASDWQEKAGNYLDASAAKWLASPPNVGNIKCAMSCHTTFSYLVVSSTLAKAGSLPSAATVRSRFEARVDESVAGTATPFYGKDGDTKTKESHATEAVLNAASLAFADLGAGSELAASTKKALDHMWKLQGADGAWQWLDFKLEPWETRNDWGAAMAALLAGSIPENTSSAQAAGTTKLIAYLQKRLPSMALHDRATVLWASGSLKNLLDAATANAIAEELRGKQRGDGGFSLPSWGKGENASSSAKSDGYATALAALALCRGTADGTKREDVHRALSWLAKNQSKDGSWPGQSLNSDSTRATGFMTDAATAYATMAITSCVR